ncbi:MAG: hypothetical protein IPK19_20485 [Chloroflexi bacterium]|nr:hypothetical protein [Chloroflexota bacterium]
MTSYILIAVDALSSAHVEAIATTVADWVTCERILEGARNRNSAPASPRRKS